MKIIMIAFIALSKVIGGDWNGTSLPDIPGLDSLLVWSCIWLHFTGLCENVSVFFDACAAGQYYSCFDHQQICYHPVAHLVPEVTD
jgi:hypothetical protein